MNTEPQEKVDPSTDLFAALPHIFQQKTEIVTVSEEWLEKCSEATGIPAYKLADMSRKERRDMLKERRLMKASRSW